MIVASLSLSLRCLSCLFAHFFTHHHLQVRERRLGVREVGGAVRGIVIEVAHGKGAEDAPRLLRSVNCMGLQASPSTSWEAPGHVCVRMFAGDRNGKQALPDEDARVQMTDADARRSARCRCKGANNRWKWQGKRKKRGQTTRSKAELPYRTTCHELGRQSAIAKAKVPIAALLMLLTPTRF